MTAISYAALGDSMSAGLADDGLRPWPELVADALGARLAILAETGLLAAEVERDQLPRAIALEPDIVTFAAGANDVLLRFTPRLGECRETIERTLATLVERLPRARILTVTYARFHLPYRPRSARRVHNGMERVNECLRETSARLGVEVVDVEADPISRGIENFLPDGLHGSELGHRRIADGVLQTLAVATAT